jgi:light-regulated signal transduction histidine kinase (bacteriophytochrome)
MGDLIDDLLAFSRTGRQVMSSSRIPMENLVRDLFKEVMATNPDRRFDLNLGKIPSALGDPSMIRQVIVNLISNAAKFTAGKDPAIISVEGWEDGDSVGYSVSDNGVGFDMEYSGKLFKVFQRLHGVGEFEGTGVGLAIVHRIIKRHGGQIWAKSKLNEGTTFSFVLPKKLKVEEQELGEVRS